MLWYVSVNAHIDDPVVYYIACVVVKCKYLVLVHCDLLFDFPAMCDMRVTSRVFPVTSRVKDRA